MSFTGFEDISSAPGNFPYTVDLSSFGAPFPEGTRVQFIWWINVRPGRADPGLLNFDGPIVAATPTFRVASSSPGIFTLGNSSVLVGGSSYTLSFNSTLRAPTRIDVWLYEGGLTFPPAANVTILATDNALRSINSSGCSTSAAGHSCVVTLPLPTSKAGFVVARVWSGLLATPLTTLNYEVLPRPVVNALPRPIASDSRTLKVPGQFFDSRIRWSIFVNSSSIPLAVVSQNASFLHVNLLSLMTKSAAVVLQWQLFGISSNLSVTTTFPCAILPLPSVFLASLTFVLLLTAPCVLLEDVNSKFYYDDFTLVVRGSGFIVGHPEEHTLSILQAGVVSDPKCIIQSLTTTQIVCKLSARLPSGGLSASVALLDGLPSDEVNIGFYYAYSSYDRIPLPSDLDLSVAPRLTFKLASPSLEDGPRNATLIAVESVLSAALNISADDIYSRLAYQRTNASFYTISVWFVTSASVSSYNRNSVSRNVTLLNAVATSALVGLAPSFNCSLTSATESIDSVWPYVVFGLKLLGAPGSPAPPDSAAIADLQLSLQILWKRSASELLIVTKAADSTNVQDDYELYIYFRSSAAQSYFYESKLPQNSSVSAAVSLIGAATNDEYSVRFLQGSALPAPERAVNAAWPWVRFLLQPTGVSPVVDPATMSSSILSASSRIVETDEAGLYLRLAVGTNSSKRAVGDSYSMSLYFTTPDATSALNSKNLPNNATAIAALASSVSSATSGSYNATYTGTSVGPDSQSQNNQPVQFPVLQVSVGVVAAVVAFAVVGIVAFIFYRRRFRALENARKAATKVPEEMAAMFSIKAADLEMAEKLGEGSFGAVYKAKYRGRWVAVKKLAASVLGNAVSEFFREASLMMGLVPHRNIVRVFGMCQELGNYSMVMELLPGGSLDGLLAKRKVAPTNPLPEIELYKLARGIALGMKHLSASGIIHRDLAARNILLDSQNVPRVSDFGFSRNVGDQGTAKTQSAVGPIRWMAPEQIGEQQYSEKSDVWAYGALLVELITGNEPFPNQDLMQVAVNIRDGKEDPLTHVPKETEAPDWMMKLIQSCFVFEAEHRYSFSEVINFLTANAPDGFQVDPDEERAEDITDLNTKSGKATKQTKTPGETNYTSLQGQPDGSTQAKYATTGDLK